MDYLMIYTIFKQRFFHRLPFSVTERKLILVLIGSTFVKILPQKIVRNLNRCENLVLEFTAFQAVMLTSTFKELHVGQINEKKGVLYL